MILRLLEEGKITVEETAELLGALEASARSEPVDRRSMAQEPSPAPAGGGEPRLPLVDGIERLLDSLTGFFGETHRITSVVDGAFAAGTGRARVSLATYNGRIEVRVWDRPGYRLELVKQVRARDGETARRMAEGMGRVTQGDQFVAVENERHVPGGMRVTCWLPQDLAYELEGRTSNGRITVEGLTAERVKLRTSNGRVELAGGRCRDGEIDTSNGRIVVAAPVDRLAARTSNGRVEIIPPGGLRAGACDVHTSNGPVQVRLAGGTPVRLDLSTHLGRIEVEAGEVHYEFNERGVHSRVVGATPGFASGGPGVDLKVRTSNGSIRVATAVDGD
ncbi:MAG TPA: DUF4097 family beta strand repeat-containing protein, partial [Bacillota bacterium]